MIGVAVMVMMFGGLAAFVGAATLGELALYPAGPQRLGRARLGLILLVGGIVVVIIGYNLGKQFA